MKSDEAGEVSHDEKERQAYERYRKEGILDGASGHTSNHRSDFCDSEGLF